MVSFGTSEDVPRYKAFRPKHFLRADALPEEVEAAP
jgi:hypothetical protein